MSIHHFTSYSFYALRNKRETRSYAEIRESLGVDKPLEILFVTDVFQEAVAAKAAGIYLLLDPFAFMVYSVDIGCRSHHLLGIVDFK